MIDSIRYPRSAAFFDELTSLQDRFIVPQIETMRKRFGNEYLDFLEKILLLASASKSSPVDAVLDFTMMILKEQASFRQTETYSHESFDDVYNEVYNNPDVMEGYYLDGLLLTQSCWEIHYYIHRFFLEHFVPECKGKKQGLEIGFGHGLYLYEILELADVSKIFGMDISEYSLKYANRLLRQKFTDEQFSLKIGDVQKGLDFPEQSMEFGLMPEVIEHIHDPDKAILRMRHCLKPGSPLFIVTPMNSSSMDHITNFNSIDEIKQLIVSAGFTLKTGKVFSTKQFQPESADKTETFCGVYSVS